VNKLKVDAETQAWLDKGTEWIKENVKGEFKLCAFYTPGLKDVRVLRKDCSYYAKRVSKWTDIHIDSYCPWWKPWAKYVGFEVYYPWVPELMEIVSVRFVLERVLQKDPTALGNYRWLYFWLARGLDVKIYKEEEEK
jgi:hypothetical protein